MKSDEFEKMCQKAGIKKDVLCNTIFTQQMKLPSRFRIKYCNNQFCLEKEKRYLVGYLKTKKKNIPICGFRNFCPDAQFHYFDYKPDFVKKEDTK